MREYASALSWGTVPDWASGIGTVLAFTLALGLGLREIRLRRIAQRDDEVRQARLILVGEPAHGDAIKGGGFNIFVTVRNFSDEPVHEVVMGLEIRRGGIPGHRVSYGFPDFVGEAQREDSDEKRRDKLSYSRYIMFQFLAPKGHHEIAFGLPEGRVPSMRVLQKYGSWTPEADDGIELVS